MQQYDLIVIGGGILGTFHAYHALKLGKKVLLLEKNNYPVGATVRNFGQIVPSGMTEEWFGYGERSLELYTAIQREFDISVRKNGSLYVASDQDEQALIHELGAYYKTKGYEARVLSAESVLEKYPALNRDYVKEALFFPRELSVEPGRMIHRLQAYMEAKFNRFKIRYNTPAIACTPTGGGAAVIGGDGREYRTGKVIICNGYEFNLLYPEIFRRSGQVVSKLQMLRTVPMPETGLEGNILTGLTIRRYESFEKYCPSFKSITTPEHYRELKQWGIHILFKKAADGSIIIGDSHEYADIPHVDDLGFGLNLHINELMLKEAQRIVNFDVRKLAAAWTGFYPQHNEKQIVEYDVEENIHIRTCIGGKGMTAGPGYAEASIHSLFG